MKSRTLMCVTAMTLFAALALPVPLAAQHTRYKLIDLGTFGGPATGLFGVGTHPLNNRVVATGGADTATPDPFAPSCFGDCFVQHTFRWQNGVLTDLGALPGVNSGGGPNDINANGVITGISTNGGPVDPITGVPEFTAVVWKDGQIIKIDTFGGNFSYANAINDRDQVAGFALNATPDSSGFADLCMNPPFGQQARAFIWENGVTKKLGTLGGPDSCALWINQKGQAAGHSFTNSTPNATTGIPTVHPFLWDHGTMLDLGTLGGTSFALAINSKGQVVGRSRIGPVTEPLQNAFLWEHGGPMIDLNTFVPLGLDLTLTEATFINDRGEISVQGFLPNGDTRAVLLVPCGGGEEGCQIATEGATAVTQNNLVPQRRRTPSGIMAAWRARMAQRYHIHGLKSSPRD